MRTVKRDIPIARLRQCFTELAGAITRGECTPRPEEIRAIRAICRRRGVVLPPAIARLAKGHRA